MRQALTAVKQIRAWEDLICTADSVGEELKKKQEETTLLPQPNQVNLGVEERRKKLRVLVVLLIHDRNIPVIGPPYLPYKDCHEVDQACASVALPAVGTGPYKDIERDIP